MMSVKAVLLVAVALSLVGAGEAKAQTQDCNGYSSGVSAVNASRGWTTIWEDDFNTGTLDISRWTKLESVQNNQSPGINVPSKVTTPGDGKLHIGTEWNQAQGRYLSGFVTTRPAHSSFLEPVPDDHPLQALREGGTQPASQGFSFKYGRIEVCMKAPTYWNGSANSSNGVHFSVWLMPTDGSWPPELDVAESYAGIGAINQNVHYGSWPDNKQAHGQRTYLCTAEDPICTSVVNDYHLYAMEWSDTEIHTFIDGALTKVLDSSNLMMNGRNALAELNAKSGFYLIVDTQVQQPNIDLLDSATGSTETLIDWVKVFYKP